MQSKGTKAFEDDNDNLERSSFLSIEEDLHQYTGLIYDGAFSENQSNFKGDGLTGEEINREEAENKIRYFIGEDRIKEVSSNFENENGRIIVYNFDIHLSNDSSTMISISKKGGHVVEMNNSREIGKSEISEEEAVNRGKEFLDSKSIYNMKETYYMNNNNVLTVNYAYTQNDVIIYPDLIKLKIALDNGEILGFESTNYLNSHKENRELSSVNLPMEEALKRVNPKIQVMGINLAIIPTEYNTEILCWEIKGKIKSEANDSEVENDFLVYINVNNGKEEDILLIVDTPNGTLTV